MSHQNVFYLEGHGCGFMLTLVRWTGGWESRLEESLRLTLEDQCVQILKTRGQGKNTRCKLRSIESYKFGKMEAKSKME